MEEWKKVFEKLRSRVFFAMINGRTGASLSFWGIVWGFFFLLFSFFFFWGTIWHFIVKALGQNAQDTEASLDIFVLEMAFPNSAVMNM